MKPDSTPTKLSSVSGNSRPARRAMAGLLPRSWVQRSLLATTALAAGAYACGGSSSPNPTGTGGAPATGGVQATGGTVATGGVATGGMKATGGTMATGGMKATGGSTELTYPVCDSFGTVDVKNGTYFFQNDVWNAQGSGEQCVDVTGLTFKVTSFTYNLANGNTPVSYPSFVKGCHFTLDKNIPSHCTTDASVPKQISAITSAMISMDTVPPSGGKWDISFDIWLDPTKGNNLQNKTEIMIWLDWMGVQPVGSQMGMMTVGGVNYELWKGNIGWDVVSFRRTDHPKSASFDLKPIIDAVVSKGWAQSSWYLNSVEGGFEGWAGLKGSQVTGFSVDVK